MSTTDIVKQSVWEDGSAVLMGRIVGTANTAILQSDISTITCKVFDLNGAAPSTATATPTITTASVIFNTLQTDARWTKDTTGYNFRYTMAATTFANGGHTYLVEFKFTMADASVLWAVFGLPVQAVWSS